MNLIFHQYKRTSGNFISFSSVFFDYFRFISSLFPVAGLLVPLLNAGAILPLARRHQVDETGIDTILLHNSKFEMQDKHIFGSRMKCGTITHRISISGALRTGYRQDLCLRLARFWAENIYIPFHSSPKRSGKWKLWKHGLSCREYLY